MIALNSNISITKSTKMTALIHKKKKKNQGAQYYQKVFLSHSGKVFLNCSHCRNALIIQSRTADLPSFFPLQSLDPQYFHHPAPSHLDSPVVKPYRKMHSVNQKWQIPFYLHEIVTFQHLSCLGVSSHNNRELKLQPTVPTTASCTEQIHINKSY